MIYVFAAATALYLYLQPDNNPPVVVLLMAAGWGLADLGRWVGRQRARR